MTATPDAAALARALPYGAYPIDGVATAGQLSEAQMAQLAAAGYRTIVDLRPAPEPRGYDERSAVERAGMTYILLPVTQQTLRDADFDRMRELLRDSQQRPLMIHCATANRVGALMLPYFALDEHRSLDDALRTAAAIGMRSPDLARMAVEYVRRHGAG